MPSRFCSGLCIGRKRKTKLEKPRKQRKTLKPKSHSFWVRKPNQNITGQIRKTEIPNDPVISVTLRARGFSCAVSDFESSKARPRSFFRRSCLRPNNARKTSGTQGTSQCSGILDSSIWSIGELCRVVPGVTEVLTSLSRPLFKSCRLSKYKEKKGVSEKTGISIMIFNSFRPRVSTDTGKTADQIKIWES